MNTSQTLGVEFLIKDIEIAGKKIRFSIHLYFKDPFKELIPSNIQGSTGVILMYDITNAETLDNLSEWYHLLKKYVKQEIPFFLVGNKKDLEEHREVSKEHIETFKENYDITSSMEISAKTGENVEHMFIEIYGKLWKV